MRFTIEMIPSVAVEPRRRSATVLFAVVAAFALVLSLLVSVSTVSAVAPNVATGSGITVDGDAGDWDDGDFFADMYRAGDAGKEVESKLSLRYDCDAGILYVLVQTAADVDLIDTNDSNFVKFGNDDKRVDGSDAPADGTQPDFEYLADDAGWEASIALTPGTYPNLNVHAQVDDGGSQTSAVEGRAISMTITCSPAETATPTPTPEGSEAGSTNTPTPTPEGSEAGSTNTPTPTATATPEGSQQGSTGTPAPSRTPEGDVAAATGTPAGGNLPNTASGTPLTTPLVAFGFGLLLLGSIGTLAYANVAANRRRR